MKKVYYLFIFLFALVFARTAFALTPEEILLLKRSGVSDEKILEMQKKEGGAAPQAAPAATPPPPAPKINAFDWNEDGKKDIITGSDSGQVYVYLNTGANRESVFGKPMKIDNVEIMRFSDPNVADWNSDGKKDIVVGAKSGEISVFLNKGNNQQPIFGDEIKLNGGDLDVGSSSSPAMVDWNNDGKKDLVVGNKSGKVFVFFNIGADNAPSFTSKGVDTNINVDSYATPFIADWNNDGKFDVICGSGDGMVYLFINEGDAKFPKFGKAQAIQINNKELRLPTPTSVVAVDWDDDGKLDLLVSNKEVTEDGPIPERKKNIPLGIYLLFNTGTKEKPEFKEVKAIKGKFRDDTVL